MTVTYTSKVASCKNFGCFLKLLLRWRGSIYKLVWPDLFIFLAFYFSLSVLYRFFLSPSQQIIFEKIAIYCEKYGTLIPVSFVLGFYVSIVIGRWWAQYINIPWIDTLAIWVSSNIRGDGDKERLLRRTLMRYTCLAVTQCFALISPRVKKRFPTMDHLIEAGLLNENEKDIILSIRLAVPKYPTHFVPLVWAASIVARARQEDKIRNDAVVKSIIDEINKIKDQCQLLLSYDWISVPLVYTQVVTLAVYTYFFSCIMGRQWLQERENEDGSSNRSSSRYGVEELDLVIPVFTILQFFFYMGWLKVAESLLNPFGDDDDDFELNWIVDRNLQVAYLIVDEMHQEYPMLLKDIFWDEIVPLELPHTIASEQYKDQPPQSSTAHVLVSKKEAEMLAAPSLRSIDHALFLEEIRQRQNSSVGLGGGGIGGGGGTELDAMNKLAAFKQSNASIRSRKERYLSQRSISNQSQVTLSGSVSGKLNRVGTAFKRMISRENSSRHPNMTTVDYGDGDYNIGASRLNMGGQDDVIEEVDENALTIVSMADRDVKKPPTVQEIFGKSQKIDEESVPMIPLQQQQQEGRSPHLSGTRQTQSFDDTDSRQLLDSPSSPTTSSPINIPYHDENARLLTHSMCKSAPK